MKLIESKAEYIPQATVPSASPEGLLEGIYKIIELAGRTAYHSQDKITPTSAKDFVDRMIRSKHGAALEHGTVYLSRDVDFSDSDYNFFETFYEQNPYSKVTYDGGVCYVSTNLRVIMENHLFTDLQYLCSPTNYHEKRYTMRFTCSRAIAQELTRHRTFSFLMESQRYINYSKERHGGEITFIKPIWCPDYDETDWDIFLHSLHKAEESYFKMLSNGFQPQQARDVLPNATKTELIMTGFSSYWRYLLDLRLFEETGKVHPDMLDLMQKAQKAMQEAGIWDDIMKYPSKFD